MRETRLYGSEGGEAKAFPTPIAPFVPPIKGGIIFNSCSRRRRPNLMLRKFKVTDVARTLVRIAGCKRTEVRATLKKRTNA